MMDWFLLLQYGKSGLAADQQMRVPGMEGKVRAGPGRECLCFDLHLHMQREGWQWTRSTRAVCDFWSFGLLRTPSLLQHAHTAHMPCDIVGSHATDRVVAMWSLWPSTTGGSCMQFTFT